MKIQHQDLLQRHLTPILTWTCLQLELVLKILILALPIEGAGIDLQRRLPTPTVVILCKIFKASNACVIVVSSILMYFIYIWYLNCLFTVFLYFVFLFCGWFSNKDFVEN